MKSIFNPQQRSLFENQPARSTCTWIPSEPPSLDGITDISFDTETTGLDPWSGDRPIGLSIHCKKGSWYLPWGHKGGGNLPEDTVKRWAQRELRGKHLLTAGGKFDLHMMYYWGVDLEEQGNTISDVQHYAALLDDHRQRFNLEALSQSYLGVGKVQGLDKNKMAEYHAGEVQQYACVDAELLTRLDTVMMPQLVEQELMRVVSLENKVIYPVARMEREGAILDSELLEKWVHQSEHQYHRLMKELAYEVGFACSPGSNNDMARLFRKLGLAITVFTESGQPSFTDLVLSHIKHPTIEKVRRIKKLKSMRSKFLLPYWEDIKKYGLLRYHLHQLRADEGGTVSGRFSASNQNVQQVVTPENQEAAGESEYIIRKLFIAKDGQLYTTGDANQVEYRIFASYSNSPKILKAYEYDPNTDFHNIVMEIIKPIDSKITRKHTKNINFAMVFGAGKDKIAFMLDLPRSQADVFVRAYNSAFPEAQQLLSEAARLASNRGYVKTVLGRRSRFLDKQRLHKALNCVVQGGNGDVHKQKIIELDNERKTSGFTMCFTVHDEVVGHAADKQAVENVRTILNRQSFPEIKVPILWSVGSGANWAEAK